MHVPLLSKYSGFRHSHAAADELPRGDVEKFRHGMHGMLPYEDLKCAGGHWVQLRP